MFRRLAEAFQDSDGSHSQYINSQNNYFNTLPNMILSGTSGLKGFDTAIQSVDTLGKGYQQPAVKNPNDIFMQDSSPNLSNLAQQCSASSVDELLAIKNPNAAIGCGWLYTPPKQGSPYPVVSQGFIGDANGPMQNYSPPEYKKWYFDLQLAKKQILFDKCKALKACSDVDSEVFQGTCGYCTDTNQGVPIDTVGQPLYGGEPLGTCSPQSIVTTSKNCPAPPGTGPGPQPIIDKTCEPVSGRLSATCLYDKLLTAGCNDNGSLAMALSGSPNPSDYIANIRDGDPVKIYNRIANPPLKLDVFSKGAVTVDAVLKEARQLAGNAKLPSNTALGAAARDLCLQSGAIADFDFCADLPDTTPPPFDVDCLQKLFRKMGGQPGGASYPSANSVTTYNAMGSLGAVKQYFNQLAADMKSGDYDTQRNAMIQFLGISPEKAIKRPPFQQGVEVFWLVPVPGVPNKVAGFLRRTIETDFIQFGGSVSSNNGGFPQVGISQFAAMLQMTDIRTPTDYSTKYQVTIDDGFFIAVNQPANIDAKVFNDMSEDQPGLFANLSIQGPTTYQSNACTNYKAATPNITKIYYDDAGGGGHQLTMNTIPCSGTPAGNSFYSLTCEARAPFLNYEVSLTDGVFQELRNPGIFSQFLQTSGLEYHMRTEERNSVPGGKGFVRLNSANSYINMPNIAYQSWGTVTFALRLQTMPVKETILNFATGPYYFSVIATPMNGNVAAISVEHNFTGGNPVFFTTNFKLNLNKWYLLFIANKGTGFDFFCNGFDELNNKQNSPSVTVNSQSQLFGVNTTMNAPSGQTQAICNIAIGNMKWPFLRGMYSTSSFNYDIAWVHFFDHYVSSDDVFRDAAANWIYTQFPDSSGTYKTL